MLSMIMASGLNGELGKNNELIWRFPEDMDFFKFMTLGNPVIMGRKTFESLPKKLNSRDNIVITNHPYRTDEKGLFFTSDVKLMIELFKHSAKEAYVIGGESIYKMFEDSCDCIYRTIINEEDPAADAHYIIDTDKFTVISRLKLSDRATVEKWVRR